MILTKAVHFFSQKSSTIYVSQGSNGTKYSRMDRVTFVGDGLETDHTPSTFTNFTWFILEYFVPNTPPQFISNLRLSR